jgi:hypothetical protein
MNRQLLRPSFIAFHVTLGVGLLWGSTTTAIEALASARHQQVPLLILGSVEAVGALLFLLPSTLRAGACLLLATIGAAVLAHLHLGEFRADLLVYAAGVWFVLVHGSAWTPVHGTHATA